MKASHEILQLLAPRELEILTLVAEGYQREQIAEALSISKLTYDSYRKNIRNKLGIKSQADWVRVLYAVGTN